MEQGHIRIEMDATKESMTTLDGLIIYEKYEGACPACGGLLVTYHFPQNWGENCA